MYATILDTTKLLGNFDLGVQNESHEEAVGVFWGIVTGASGARGMTIGSGLWLRISGLNHGLLHEIVAV